MCDVDYNCYTGGPNPKPEGALTNGRSAGWTYDARVLGN